MDNDFYDSIIPNIYIPHIEMPNMSAITDVMATTNMIAQSVDVSGICAALETTAAIASSVNTTALDGVLETTSMIADTLSTSVISDMASCSAIDNMVTATTALADSIDSSALETVSSMVNPISNVVELFAGIGGLASVLFNSVSEAVIESMQTLAKRTHEIVHMLWEHFQEFAKCIVGSVLRSKRTVSVDIAIASRNAIHIVPPIKFYFRDFSALIRKIYLPHSHERGSSDDDTNTGFSRLLCNC